MRLLRLKGRYFRTVPLTKWGYVEEILELNADRTALVVLHCWNIGCPDGPAVDPNFCVGMGFPETFEEAYCVMRDVIRPAMDTARVAEILVCHVESAQIAKRHPEAQQDTESPAPTEAYSPVVPGYRERIIARSHGRDYATRSPYAHMDRAQIVAPLPDEPFAYQTVQFDRMLRKRGIENLIYTGFATDMCILNAPGGIAPMFNLGYRVYLMRDATLGVEYPDTLHERIATRWAIRFFETHFGDTILSEDFIQACRAITRRATCRR